MKNSKHIVFLILISIVILSSCHAPLKTFSSTTRTEEIYGPGVIHKPMVAELNVQDEKVSSSKNGKINQTEQLKEDVVADALRKVNADVMVSPTFDIKQVNQNVTVTVTGYPATYIKFREMQVADRDLMKIGYTNSVELKEAVSENPTRKPARKGKVAKRVVGITLGSIGLAAVLSSLALLSEY